MLTAWERHLLAVYLSNAASSLYHRNEKASALATWVADRENRIEFGSKRRRNHRRRLEVDADEVMSARKLHRLQKALKEERSTTKARCDRTARRLRCLAKTTGLDRTDVGILELLLRYRTQPMSERLSVNDCAQVVYRLKHPFGDGTTHVVLDPIDFLARLAALVPRPRTHLTRYHGGFAPNFKHRDHIIPAKAHSPKGDSPSPRAPLSWMHRLKRVFRIDIEHCPKCGARVRIIACIETPEVIKTILSHLAAREDGGARRARAPPPSPGGLAPSHSLTVS